MRNLIRILFGDISFENFSMKYFGHAYAEPIDSCRPLVLFTNLWHQNLTPFWFVFKEISVFESNFSNFVRNLNPGTWPKSARTSFSWNGTITHQKWWTPSTIWGVLSSSLMSPSPARIATWRGRMVSKDFVCSRLTGSCFASPLPTSEKCWPTIQALTPSLWSGKPRPKRLMEF